MTERMHNWHWQTWEERPYLTCSLLDPWPHGFFTQQFASQNLVDLVKVLRPKTPVYRTKQVHGKVVVSTREISPLPPSSLALAEPKLQPADGIISEGVDLSVWVCTADCTPVLIGDARTGQVAAIHSGWRGTAAGIVGEAIARLLEQGSQLADLRVAMGPAISGDVYQVSLEVAENVVATVVDEGGLDGKPLTEQLDRLPDGVVEPDPDPGRIRLDIRRAIALQLHRLGLHPEQVAIAPHCTYQMPEYFFSYRRTAEKNVQWSGIASTTVST